MSGSQQLIDLLDEIISECAAYTSVLEGHKVARAIVVLPYHAAFLNQRGINVDFADIVDNHCKAYAAFIGENPVEQCGFATAEVSGEEKYGSIVSVIHNNDIIFCKLTHFLLFLRKKQEPHDYQNTLYGTPLP